MTTILTRTAALIVALGSSIAMAQTRLNGAGATFPNPVYQRWTTEYQKLNPTVRIDYQSIGSGGGLKGITDKTIDFAGSDAPMNKKEQAAANAPLLQIPTVAGAVVLAYNLPNLTGDLKLTGPLITEIYLGKVSKWNDPQIATINPDLKLPNLAITPVWRTDGSGTSFVFTNYLATQSNEFISSIGAGKQVQWPVGQGGKGNEGVTAVVQQTPGAIGYIELTYATANKIPFASLKNKDGKFVKASAQTVAAAGAGALDRMGKSLAVDIWNQPGPDAYPIAAFTYIIVYQDLSYLKDQTKAKALVEFLTWATHGDAQKVAEEMDYAPLAPPVQQKVKAAIDTLTWNGQPIR
ncbi:MAG TPA: phosphate ABC transporter substrate-binding protein PstS [Tepidisphaeraceae bacterium]|nr:phosphate ABC transporter substrate-binding protein PstS [Tepidisphaeraceae bacterium]